MMGRIFIYNGKKKKEMPWIKMLSATDYQKNLIESKMFLTRGMSDGD